MAVGGQTVFGDPWVVDFHKGLDDKQLGLLPTSPSCFCLLSVEHHQPALCSSSLEVSPSKFFNFFCNRDVVPRFSGPVTAVGHKSSSPVLDHL